NHAEIGLRTSVNPTYHQLYELLRKKPFRGPIKYVLVTSFDGVVELRLINGGTTLGRHFTHAHLLCEGDVVIACGMLDMQVSTGRPTIIIDGESTNFPTTEESVTLSGTDLDHMTKAQPCGLKVARGTLKSLYPQCSI
ncbi:MAG TPA: hypothetical protein VJC18_07205, partial [bacterium]|nr:hypothetical protein [bacterium]